MQMRREGMALMLVVMLVMVTTTITAGAAILGSGSWLLSQYKERQGQLQTIADAGLEEGRAMVNGNKTLYPDSNFRVLEDNVVVTDASGAAIPGVRRSTYVGPIGVTTGQYGVFGSVVSVAQTSNGDRVVRRLEIVQESFAKYAYFTDLEPSTISFGGGDQLFGPVHSNSSIQINSSRATFHGPVTTAGTIINRTYGTFNSLPSPGFTERVARIPMPQTADLNKLRVYATQGSTALVSTTAGGPGQASMRIEFVNVDLNGDGDATDDDEGFMRVYRHAGNVPTAAFLDYANGKAAIGAASRTCGDIHNDGIFYPANVHRVNNPAPIDQNSWNGHRHDYSITTHPNRTCLLGGDPRLFPALALTNGGLGAFAATAVPGGTFTHGAVSSLGNTTGNCNTSIGDGMGGCWLRWNGAADPRLTAPGQPMHIRTSAAYLYPLSRQLNPGFKGVIFVDGKVAISGTLRARITLAATQDIIYLDDTRYSVDPGAGTCKDILGIFAGNDVTVSDNHINAPQSFGGTYRTYDETRDEFIHSVVLALQNFGVENYGAGSTDAEACGTQAWGRGCLFLTGGIIQYQRGAVATAAGYGNLKRYSYDPCAFTNPPPYFPTTGHFARSRIFDVDASSFSVSALFDNLTPN